MTQGVGCLKGLPPYCQGCNSFQSSGRWEVCDSWQVLPLLEKACDVLHPKNAINTVLEGHAMTSKRAWHGSKADKGWAAL